MKLQRQLSKVIGDTYYPKWIVVIPPEMIRQVGWKAGTELEAQVKGKTIVLQTKT